MTYGLRAYNLATGYVTVDEDSTTYVYLGKWAIDTNNPYEQDIYINCVGYPMIFFGLPYNTVNGGENSAGVGHTFLTTRAGIQMTRLRPAGDGLRWIVTIRCNFVNGGNPGPLYVRAFGLLHLNFPNGSGAHWGARLWNQNTGQIFIDSGCRPLRLAGNSYDTQIAMPPSVPSDTDRVDASDTTVALPFDLANKSIMANTRGTMTYPYYTGTYIDGDTQQSIDTYDVEKITTMFWSTGSTLRARRVSVPPTQPRFEGSGIFIIDTSRANTVYSGVSVIDNNLFP